MQRKPNRTTISEIVDYWAARVDECNLSIDWAEAEEYCWRCGSPKDLTRCHIIPHSLGGNDEPSNYVLLCRACHEEAPNVADPEIMWDWLTAHKSPLYKSFWVIEGMREYEFIYKRSVAQDLAFILEGNKEDAGQFDELMEKSIADCSRHFGQSAPNRATGAGVFRMMLKHFAQAHGKTLPDERNAKLIRRENTDLPWI